jgi:hypothetical protein
VDSAICRPAGAFIDDEEATNKQTTEQAYVKHVKLRSTTAATTMTMTTTTTKAIPMTPVETEKTYGDQQQQQYQQ